MSRPASMSITQTVVTVPAATNTSLVVFNPLRKYLAIANIGTGQGSLAFDKTAVVNQGYPLAPAASLGAQGGGLLWEAGAVPLNGVNVISTAGTTVVVLEGV